MTRLVYLAHPVRPANRRESWRGNIDRAMEYRDALYDAGVDVIAPWLWSAIASTEADDERDREAIMQRCERYAAACGSIVLCGERVSIGMRREARACENAGGCVIDVTGASPEEVAHLVAEDESHGVG